MNIILLEDNRFPIDSFLQKVYERYPRSSILHVNNRNFSDVLPILNDKPLLTRNWCLIISDKLNGNQYSKLMKGDNLNIIHLSNKNKFPEMKNLIFELGFKATYVNNLQPDKEKIIDYVKDSLNIEYSEAKYICGRHRYHIPTIVNTISVLSTFDVVDRKTIKNYTTRFGTISLYSLTDKILGLDNKITKQQMVKLIHSYRYGFSFILSFLVKELEKFLCVYDYMERGLIGLDNYLDFEPDMEDKVFKTISEFQLKKIINAYSVLSFDKLYFIYLHVKKIKPKQSNIYKLILIGG